MAATPLHSVAVTGIVVRPSDGRILVIQRADDGRWAPPGGVLKLDESSQECAVREVLEETGLLVEPVRLTGIYKNMQRGIVTLAFLCRPVGGSPRPSEESTEVLWLTQEEAEAHIHEAQMVRISDALSDGGPFVRVHDGRRLLS